MTEILNHRANTEEGAPTTEAPLLSGHGLVQRGIALPAETGALICTDKGFRNLEKAQQRRYRNTPPKSETGVSKNNSWSGQLLTDLAESLVDLINSSSPVTSQLSVRIVYREMRALGHKISVGSLRSAINIFADCDHAAEIYHRMTTHKTYGDSLRSLSPAEKKEWRTARDRKLLTALNTLSTQERKQLRAASEQNLIQHATSSADSSDETQNLFSGKNIERAYRNSFDLEALEHESLPGEMFEYEDVLEKMRSSWEALYARVINKSPMRNYVYEPMGFPLLDPVSGNIAAYHPDFLEIIDRPHGVQVRFVEIKGKLSDIGQLKIKLFRQYYIESNFDGLSDAQLAFFKPLIEQTKKSARQFCVDFSDRVGFEVWGEAPWDTNNSQFSTSTQRPGMIPRLREYFPECECAPQQSKSSASQRKKLNLKIYQAHEGFGQGKARLARSAGGVFDASTAAYLFSSSKAVLSAIILQAESKAKDENILTLLALAAESAVHYHRFSSAKKQEFRRTMKALSASQNLGDTQHLFLSLIFIESLTELMKLQFDNLQRTRGYRSGGGAISLEIFHDNVETTLTLLKTCIAESPIKKHPSGQTYDRHYLDQTVSSIVDTAVIFANSMGDPLRSAKFDLHPVLDAIEEGESFLLIPLRDGKQFVDLRQYV